MVNKPKYVPDYFSEAAKIAAAILVSNRKLLLSGFGVAAIKELKTNIKDFVTQIDIDVETSLKSEIEAKLQQPLQGEELGYDKQIDTYWLSDPIDGTNGYVRGLPYATSALAFVENDQVKIGFIYDFVMDVLYSAELGKGAYRNAEPITVSNRKLEEGLFALTYRTQADTHKTTHQYFEYLRSYAWPYEVVASCHKLAMLASGKIELYTAPSGSGKEWDKAAGMLLVREAGGVYKDFSGNDTDFHAKAYIASNRAVYDVITTDSDSPFYLG